MPIPPPYDNPPEISPAFNAFMWAFDELSRERAPSEVSKQHVRVHRISYAAIREWADYRGFSDDADFMQELIANVRALDTVWVEVETKRLKRGAKDG